MHSADTINAMIIGEIPIMNMKMLFAELVSVLETRVNFSKSEITLSMLIQQHMQDMPIAAFRMLSRDSDKKS
jgi:hypothetical protein